MEWRTHIADGIRGEWQFDAPLAVRTSVRVGGTAAILVRPADVDDLVETLRLARDLNQPVTVFGGGANTVVGDGGVAGLSIRLGNGPDVIRDLGDRLELEIPAGAPSARLAHLAAEHRLLGADWAAGIPGTVGGLTAMNAGTRAGEMKDALAEVLLAGPGGAVWSPAAILNFGYRHSELHGKVVAAVRCRLRKGDEAELAASADAIETDRAYRKRTQPLNLPNSGSVFRNPPGDFAGRLVEAVGLKGHSEGGASISGHHANFIVNRGGATARDVTTLMAAMQTKVHDRFQILLALEVRLVGQFVPSPEVLGLVVEP